MSKLTLNHEGGLCNRIITITSTIAFAQKHNLKSTVYWYKDWNLGANFLDLFKEKISTVKFKLIPIEIIQKQDITDFSS